MSVRDMTPPRQPLDLMAAGKAIPVIYALVNDASFTARRILPCAARADDRRSRLMLQAPIVALQASAISAVPPIMRS